MSATEVGASIARLRETIPSLTDSVENAQKTFDNTVYRVRDLRKEIDNWGTSTATQATAATGMWAPAAMSASIATMGAASTVGTTAYSTALMASKGLAVAGAREHGGPVLANSMYRVGEGGKPEIFKASNGSQYMIPGDNGSVISNKDIGNANGSGGVSLEVNFNITTTNGIDEATQKQMAQQMEIVALKVAREQSTRDGGFLQKRIRK